MFSQHSWHVKYKIFCEVSVKVWILGKDQPRR